MLPTSVDIYSTAVLLVYTVRVSDHQSALQPLRQRSSQSGLAARLIWLRVAHHRAPDRLPTLQRAFGASELSSAETIDRQYCEAGGPAAQMLIAANDSHSFSFFAYISRRSGQYSRRLFSFAAFFVNSYFFSYLLLSCDPPFSAGLIRNCTVSVGLSVCLSQAQKYLVLRLTRRSVLRSHEVKTDLCLAFTL